jgi:hypothetical protein
MRIPDYIALGVLIVLIVWAVADWFPQGISEALRLRTVGTVRARPLFATGLGGLGLLGWRRKRKAQAVA